MAGMGDEAAFAEFYDAMSGMVHGVVQRVLRNDALAEEVTQEVFLEIWRLAPRFAEQRGTPHSWAATIAHRRAVDRVRSEQSHRVRTEREAQFQPQSHDVVSELVEEKLDSSEVRASLLVLSEPQRQAVTMAYYGGHTYREVAALLRVPEGTIKTRIREGLQKLRLQMGVTT